MKNFCHKVTQVHASNSRESSFKICDRFPENCLEEASSRPTCGRSIERVPSNAHKNLARSFFRVIPCLRFSSFSTQAPLFETKAAFAAGIRQRAQLKNYVRLATPINILARIKWEFMLAGGHCPIYDPCSLSRSGAGRVARSRRRRRRRGTSSCSLPAPLCSSLISVVL